MTNTDHTAPALQRADMPKDFSISLDNYVGRSSLAEGYGDGEQRIPDNFGPTQSMTGFEAIYPNIIDYIVRITYKIWEDRDVEYIADTYSDDSMVFDDYGLQRGNQKIIADTHHTTGAFSDIKLIADEIIWAGNDEVGYHTSHRTLIRGTNDGASKYGPATGKTVDILVIANCVAKGNKIFLEHVLYNNSCMLQQLGMDLNEMAAQMAAEKPAGWPRSDEVWNQLRSATAPAIPISKAEPIGGFDPDRFAREVFQSVWCERNFGTLNSFYQQGFECSGPTERAFTGAADYQSFLESLFSCFPDFTAQMDEVYWMGNDDDGYVVAERWSATATHSGEGMYGGPTNAAVQIWGIIQHRIKNGIIEREWMLFNELDLMMQIAEARQA